MAVTFQCRDDSALEGAPLRARPCRCERPVIDEDGLCICGRWPAQTVDYTWSQQAWRNAKEQRMAGQRAPRREVEDWLAA